MAKHDFKVVTDYLSVMVKGSLSVPEFKQITDDVLAVCLENDIHKVIFDVLHTRGIFSDSDKTEFATYASATLKNDVEKFAYIYPHEKITYTPQTISQGSGFNVRACETFDDAIAWIEE